MIPFLFTFWVNLHVAPCDRAPIVRERIVEEVEQGGLSAVYGDREIFFPADGSAPSFYRTDSPYRDVDHGFLVQVSASMQEGNVPDLARPAPCALPLSRPRA